MWPDAGDTPGLMVCHAPLCSCSSLAPVPSLLPHSSFPAQAAEAGASRMLSLPPLISLYLEFILQSLGICDRLGW